MSSFSRLISCCISLLCSANGGEVELLPLISRPRAPTLLCGHWGGATQRFAAKEDWAVSAGKGKTSDRTWRDEWMQEWALLLGLLPPAQVHLAMVRYHEAGRFCEKDEQWDQESAVFHLERAALCGELEAIVALGQCYLQLPHHILPDVEVEVTCSFQPSLLFS